jgi:hypothetical protein
VQNFWNGPRRMSLYLPKDLQKPLIYEVTTQFNLTMLLYSRMFECIPYVTRIYTPLPLRNVSLICICHDYTCRSQWPTGLKRGTAAARLLGFWVRIPPEAWIFVSHKCCVLSGRGLCVGLISHPEESYQAWCVQWLWLRSPVRGAMIQHRVEAPQKKNYMYVLSPSEHNGYYVYHLL